MSTERIHGTDQMSVEDQIADIVQLDVPTPTVDRMLEQFRTQWRRTCAAALVRAEELETAATELREQSARLEHALQLADEVKAAVLFEIGLRKRTDSLALVNPSE